MDFQSQHPDNQWNWWLVERIRQSSQSSKPNYIDELKGLQCTPTIIHQHEFEYLQLEVDHQGTFKKVTKSTRLEMRFRCNFQISEFGWVAIYFENYKVLQYIWWLIKQEQKNGQNTMYSNTYPDYKINCKYEVFENISVTLNFVINKHFFYECRIGSGERTNTCWLGEFSVNVH